MQVNLNYLQQFYGDRLIIGWFFFLFGHLKIKVLANVPHTVEDLENSITHETNMSGVESIPQPLVALVHNGIS